MINDPIADDPIKLVPAVPVGMASATLCVVFGPRKTRTRIVQEDVPTQSMGTSNRFA